MLLLSEVVESIAHATNRRHGTSANDGILADALPAASTANLGPKCPAIDHEPHRSLTSLATKLSGYSPTHHLT